MSLLLNIFVDIFLPLIVLCAIIIIAIIMYKKLQKKYNTPVEHGHKASSNPQVKLKTPFCTEKEMVFLNALHKALPRDCISFPNVGVSKLIEGMKIDEAIKRLKGIPCGHKSTSCPDQLSIALEEAKNNINK